MKKVILATLIVGFIGLSGFNTDSVVYEQVAFDYFISDILVSDFKDISAFEFKGETEHDYSTFGKYKFCLKPVEKLQSIVEDAAKGSRKGTKKISYEQVKTIAITEFKTKSKSPKVYVYPAMRVADNFYVFLSFQMTNEPVAKYVFEINPDGEISRNCRMD